MNINFNKFKENIQLLKSIITYDTFVKMYYNT